jgi:uncharacterized protein (UPF0332 family)
MKPFEFWVHAQELLENDKASAASLRSVTSRAYYAAFHTAVAFLKAMGITIPRSAEKKHKRAAEILGNTGDDDLNDVGTRLDHLRGERNRADYDLDDPESEDKGYAELRFREAGDVITALESCRRDAVRFAAVTAAATRWAQELSEGRHSPVNGGGDSAEGVT